MDTENPQIVNFVYELDDGQVIEIYQGDDLPFPLMVQAEQDVAASSEVKEAETTEDHSEEMLQSILLAITDFNEDVRTQNENLSIGFTWVSALIGVLVGFMSAKELLKIWLL